MKVVVGEVVELPLGPPFKPLVQITAYRRGAGNVELELAFIGAGGERVTNLMVAGGWPPAPTLEILDPDEVVVATASR